MHIFNATHKAGYFFSIRATPALLFLLFFTSNGGKERSQSVFMTKAFDAFQALRFNAPRCPDSSVGRA
ncbi:hypothetical protein, partial [[Pantoea] beijingensis]|uniref:hypothetical protein n=1 Tax=[Pantoea] beijingensis TaxID=1324864 RepID=UPI001C720F12